MRVWCWTSDTWKTLCHLGFEKYQTAETCCIKVHSLLYVHDLPMSCILLISKTLSWSCFGEDEVWLSDCMVTGDGTATANTICCILFLHLLVQYCTVVSLQIWDFEPLGTTVYVVTSLYLWGFWFWHVQLCMKLMSSTSKHSGINIYCSPTFIV